MITHIVGTRTFEMEDIVHEIIWHIFSPKKENTNFAAKLYVN